MSLSAALLAGPFLGPAVWEPVAVSLHDEFGVTAMVPAPVPAVADPMAILAALQETLPAQDDLLLVAHSNAGLYVPALTRALPVRGVVFVDAVLPPAKGDVPVAPEGLRELLRGRVDADGLLPPWTNWWPEDDIAHLFPDTATRKRVEAEQRRMPFDYLTARVELPDGWDRIPAAYLAFGDTYAEELADAQSRGWPVRTMPGAHLHMLREPRAVAAEIMRLAGEAGVSPTTSAPVRPPSP
ncbi:hypothetical protein DP939_33560 [Spongiactinospora rosea]|uniref:AB hydrolase-1 domain-containing protein n=1 Tax=Spongiactinospora rosea TaxID=2248750 RepID=A0A366LQM2_9ACTN|nr:alpha/beta hydrolase [Spongiactinospora rosea]RBQ15930.1 hypothetical protein DP939_33560 [Spongiactinospora rosea]